MTMKPKQEELSTTRAAYRGIMYELIGQQVTVALQGDSRLAGDRVAIWVSGNLSYCGGEFMVDGANAHARFCEQDVMVVVGASEIDGSGRIELHGCRGDA